MHQSLRTLCLVMLTVLGAAGATRAEEGSAPAVHVTALRGPLHLLQGAGGNVVASVGKDGVLLVDDDYPQYAAAYEAALAQLAGSPAVPRLLLNTHWHGDHSGNNAHWGGQGAVIVAHHNVRTRMSSRQDIAALGMVVEPSPAEALPLVTFADSLALHFNGSDIEVRHYPAGHTDGDSVVFYSQENVVHTGDLFFRDAFPFIDLSSGGSVDGYIANVEALLARLDAQALVVPGHGAVASRDDLARYRHMLVTTTASVRKALAAGDSVADITARGLGTEWADWGKGFVKEAQWIGTIAADR